MDWLKEGTSTKQVPFRPARILMQDFTGVAAVVGLAAMGDGIVRLGGKPETVNSLVSVDLVIDHSVMVDVDTRDDALLKNVDVEFERPIDSSTRPEQRGSFVPGKRIPPTLRNEMAKLLADIIHSLMSSKLEKMIVWMRGSSPRRDEPLAIVELVSSGEPLERLLALLNETVLRVGPLELDLIDRAAKRGDRHIDLRPREFQLLKYMMQRSDKLLTRATLLKEVWHYASFPKTNVVDVQMGLLRRKIDGANETPMIRNVRGAGFVLDATPLSQGSPKKHNDEVAVSRGPVSSSLGSVGTTLPICPRQE
ncbi:MAG TPA: winged helix-turn-helix domain-containing protein [Steroidobacteraceae bacterium]